MGRSSAVARTVGRALTAARIGVRFLTPLDTNPVPASWTHVTKVDPEDEKRLPLLYPLYLRHTSAVSVGGSSDVTAKNTEETFALLEHAPVPAFHEPSAPAHVTDRTREACHFLAIPEVLNGDVESLIGALGEGVEYIREEMATSEVEAKLPWLSPRRRDRLADAATGWLIERAIFEAYIIQNVDSAAARESGVTEDDLLDPKTARQRALAAEKHLGSEVIYLEYSGRYGGEEALDILSAVDDGISWPRIWYGGGLDDRDRVNRILDAGADAVVVGDVFHEIASEEAELASRARSELDSDASTDQIREWTADALSFDSSPSRRYLSTTPQVIDPESTAFEYTSKTIEVVLELSALADSYERTGGDLERFLENRTLPGETILGSATGESGRSLAREYALATLACCVGTVEGTEGHSIGSLPLHHVEVV